MLISIGLCLVNLSIRQDVCALQMNLKRMNLTSIGPDGIAWLLGVCYAQIRILSKILINTASSRWTRCDRICMSPSRHSQEYS